MFFDIIFKFETQVSITKLELLPFKFLEKEIEIDGNDFSKYSLRYLSKIKNLKTNTGKVKFFPNLERLVVKFNEENTVLEIGSKNLKMLDVSYTNITFIPKIERLEILHCYNCYQLENIQSLPSLKNLDCTNCFNLLYLPDLPELRELDCAETGLLKIGKTPKLEFVCCNFNQDPGFCNTNLFEEINEDVSFRHVEYFEED